MADRVGQQLGNYRLVRLLGQGGFADVYLGEHIHLKSPAAIKVLQVRLVGSALEQFRHEGQTIASLIHPNIVRVFDFAVEQESGTPFMVMDYAPNGTLRQRYPRGTVLSPTTILPHFMQIARALQYAHDRKLIHRDVKPENMLLGPNHEVLLSDFGLVLLAQSTGSQITKEMAGTLPYMAPEQINGKPRPASDQYALGIVLYEWLSGEQPFQGSVIEIATQQLMTPPAPLYGKVPGLSRAMEEVLFIALAKDPQKRFARIEAFANAFALACQTAQADAVMPRPMNSPQNLSSSLTFLNPPPNPSQQSPSSQSTFISPSPNSSQRPTLMNMPHNNADYATPPEDDPTFVKPSLSEGSQPTYVTPTPGQQTPTLPITSPVPSVEQTTQTALPLGEDVFRLEPRRARGRGNASYILVLQKSGTTPAHYALSGEDDGQKMAYQFGANPVDLELGKEVRVPMTVKTRRHWVGRGHPRPFRVYARPAGSTSPLTTAGEFVNMALLPGWLLLVIAVVLAVGLILGSIFALLPGLPGVPIPTPIVKTILTVTTDPTVKADPTANTQGTATAQAHATGTAQANAQATASANVTPTSTPTLLPTATPTPTPQSSPVTEFPIPTNNSNPSGITSGPDGNLWFTEGSGNQIGKMTPSGTFTEYPVPTSKSGLENITSGPDGNLWFTEDLVNRIGRITPSGSITEFPLPNGGPDGITSGPLNSVWFTEWSGNKSGRITAR